MFENSEIFSAYRERIQVEALGLMKMEAYDLGRAVPLSLIEQIMRDDEFFAHYVVYSQEPVSLDEVFRKDKDRVIGFFRMFGVHINWW